MHSYSFNILTGLSLQVGGITAAMLRDGRAAGLVKENERLKAAIAEHHAQKADDRCSRTADARRKSANPSAGESASTQRAHPRESERGNVSDGKKLDISFLECFLFLVFIKGCVSCDALTKIDKKLGIMIEQGQPKKEEPKP